MTSQTRPLAYDEIIYELDGPVATITINRPSKLNALTDLTQAEIRHALDCSERNGKIIGTILTGAGKGFCSGVDMGSLTKMSKAGASIWKSHEKLLVDPGNPDNDPNFLSSPAYFLGLRKPLIAAVNGASAGLGFSYATFCDLRFVERTAKFVTSFGPRGLIAEHGTSWMLPRLVGPSNALDLLWTSKRLDAVEAFRIGYANRLCENGKSAIEAKQYLNKLAKTSAPISIMMMKKQVYRHLNRELGVSIEESKLWMDESLKREDFKEGVSSFVEKRSPNFQSITVD